MKDSTATDRAPAFGAPVERDGATVVPVTSSTSHTASAGDGRTGHGPTAQMAGVRPLGAFEVRDGRVRWHPVVDVTRVVTTAEVVVGAVAVASRLARRPSPAVARVTMGPGGWVSMKGGAMAVRPAARLWRRARPPAPVRRPWWARLLAATALERLVG
ncbi:hypothetical protein SAMN04488107_1432 [Geodermatophilus saharensis]|uniref:Uncharacterized protein n=1 Tax=Geodermatophilus saharensis TaxID=1137994 RepID=A0A239BTZ4_9ACTN|nr:hypothetical protein [Geodermatophilus saharensis]SNS11386.1 hypothetical protein SAMN04488107_1432 [Geodermatophilus saharensis]